MKLYVCEEYGYRSWVWEYPHDRQQLVQDWKAGRAPLDFFDPSTSEFDGELLHLRTGVVPKLDTTMSGLAEHGYDAFIHTHDPEDTYLQFPGEKPIPQNPDRWDGE